MSAFWEWKPAMFSRAGNQSSSILVSFLAYDEVDDAVRIANDSDLSSAARFSLPIPNAVTRSHDVSIPAMSASTVLKMAPNVPFGGYKQSGLGREGGPEDLEAFLETKAIYRIGMA